MVTGSGRLRRKRNRKRATEAAPNPNNENNRLNKNTEKMRIKKGKKYRCISSYPCFSEGTIYPCHEEDILVDDDGDKRGVDFRSINSWFELVQEPSTEDLLKRIEALEKKILQNELLDRLETKLEARNKTSAKFKEIADHVNAINDIIKNAT